MTPFLSSTLMSDLSEATSDYRIELTAPSDEVHCEWLREDVISGWLEILGHDPGLHAAFPAVPQCVFESDQGRTALTWRVNGAGDVRDAMACFLEWIGGAPQPIVEVITQRDAEVTISAVDPRPIAPD